MLGPISPEFSNDTQAKDINVIPLVNITKGDFTLRLSTNNISLPDIDDGSSFHYKPLISSIPGIREKVDLDTRRYTISSLTISASNFKYDNERLSDIPVNLINADVTIYWKSQSCDTLVKCLQVFYGKVRRVNHSSDKFTFHVEDISQENLHKDLPISVLGDKGEVPERYRNKAIPMVYGDVDKSPAVISYSKSTTEETGEDVFEEIIIKLDNNPSVIMESNPLYLFDDKYLGVPGEIPEVGIPGEEGFTAPYDVDNLQYEISENKLIFKSFPSSDEDEITFAINEGNLIAYEELSPASVASYVPFREGSIGEFYMFTNSLVKTSDYLSPPATENIRIAGTLFEENNSPPYNDWGGESRTPNWGRWWNGSAWEGIGGDDVDQAPNSGVDQASITGCIVKLNPSLIDVEDTIGKLFYNIKIYVYDKDEYDDLYIYTIQLRVGGDAHGDYLTHRNFDVPDDVGTELNPYEITDGGVEDSGIITNHQQLSIYMKTIDHDFIVGAEMEFVDLSLKRWLLVKNILSRDYYAQVKGRHDGTGEYTGVAVRSYQGRAGSRETATLNPIDDDTHPGEVEIHEDVNIGTYSSDPSGQGDDGHYFRVYSDITNAKILIKFRELQTTWEEFTDIKFWYKRSSSSGGDLGDLRVYIGEYGDGDGLMHLDGNNVIGDYYWTPTDIFWDDEWDDKTVSKMDFVNVTGAPSGKIDCMVIRLDDAANIFGTTYFYYIDYITGNAESWAEDLFGCTDPDAYNYNPDATDDNGSCMYAQSPTIDLVITKDGSNWDEGELSVGEMLTIDATGSTAWVDEEYEADNHIVNIDLVLIDAGGLWVPDPIISGEQPDVIYMFTAPSSPTLIPVTYHIIVSDSLGNSSQQDIVIPVSSDPDYSSFFPDDTDGLITNPADVIHHIVRGETGASLDYSLLDIQNARMDHVFKDFYNVDEPSDYSWKFAFSQNKKINSKKLIEEIAKNTKLFPKFGNDGEFGFSSIRDVYNIDAGYVLEFKESDVINFSLSRTKVEQVYSRVKVLYKKDYADDEYKKDTGWMFFHELEQISDQGSFYENHGIEPDVQEDGEWIGGQELIFESDYIRHDDTAKALRHFLLGWNINQKNLLKVKLGLQYLKYEIGDVVAFDKVLGDTLAYGENYSRQAVYDTGEYVVRNEQRIYPLWMIIATNKNVDSVEFTLIQIHDWTTSLSRNYSEPGGVDAQMTINNQNILGASNNIGTSITEFILHNDTDATIQSSTWTFSEYNEVTGEYDALPIDPIETIGLEDATITFDMDITTPKTIRVSLSTNTNEYGIIETTDETSGNITLYMQGDVNMDGSLDILDVVMTVNGIINPSTLDDNQRYRADYNADGNINVLDVVMAVGGILGN